eukprot:4350388-Prymnesium_polylepis.1
MDTVARALNRHAVDARAAKLPIPGRLNVARGELHHVSVLVVRELIFDALGHVHRELGVGRDERLDEERMLVAASTAVAAVEASGAVERGCRA